MRKLSGVQIHDLAEAEDSEEGDRIILFKLKQNNFRKRRTGRRTAAGLLLVFCCFLAGCAFSFPKPADDRQNPDRQTDESEPDALSAVSEEKKPSSDDDRDVEQDPENEEKTPEKSAFPEYDGEAYAVINGNIPFFAGDEITTGEFENYSPLDDLGRCGPAFANISPATLPTEERGLIGDIRPSGWHTVKYEGIDGNYLYNRCHLIAYSLAGENANERNLITGTRYLNIIGMLPFEMEVTGFVHRTGMHVLYRATPVYEGEDLVARGVLLEARSVEDGGEGICFCVFCFNVQPGIEIDYATGESFQREVVYMDSFG